MQENDFNLEIHFWCICSASEKWAIKKPMSYQSILLRYFSVDKLSTGQTSIAIPKNSQLSQGLLLPDTQVHLGVCQHPVSPPTSSLGLGSTADWTKASTGS